GAQVAAAATLPGVVEVRGGHSYAAVGTYTITVLVEGTDFGPSDSFNATLAGTATVVVKSTLPWVLDAGQFRNDVAAALWLPAGRGEVAANTGAVRLTHDLDFDQSPGVTAGGTPQLVYNSDTLHVHPAPG